MKYLKLYNEIYQDIDYLPSDIHEEFCDFLGSEFQRASDSSLIYMDDFVVQVQNMDRGKSDKYSQYAGYPDWNKGNILVTILFPIGEPSIKSNNSLYIVYRLEFNKDGKLIRKKDSNFRNLKISKMKHMIDNIDLVKIQNYITNPTTLGGYLKEGKYINEFFGIFNKKKNLTFEEVELKCNELVDILYDIFDEFNIIDGNDEYYSQGSIGGILHRNVESEYPHWRYSVYGFNLKNPKDRVIIVSDMDKTDEIYSRLEKMKKNIENQIDCKINIFYNFKKKSDIFDNIGRNKGENGRIVISLLHNLKLISHDGGSTGPR